MKKRGISTWLANPYLKATTLTLVFSLGGFTSAHATNAVCTVYPTNLPGMLLPQSGSTMQTVTVENTGTGPLFFSITGLDSNTPAFVKRRDMVTDYGNPRFVKIIDLDQDGDNDVIGTSIIEQELAWWENEGGEPASWTRHVIADDSNIGRYVGVSDMDGDHDLDLVVAEFFGDKIRWYENINSTTMLFRAHTVAQGLDGASSVDLVDVDGDGATDIVSSTYEADRIQWWKKPATGNSNWLVRTVAIGFEGASSVRGGDIDGDGDMDLCAAGVFENAITWWENTGSNGLSWSEHVVDSNFDGADTIDLVDLDDDGDTDILAAARGDDEIAWWSNEGGEGLAWNKHLVAGSIDGADSARAVDIDDDGDLDIIGVARYGDAVYWWESLSSNSTVWLQHRLGDNVSFSEHFDYPLWVDAGDLDGDGKKDLAAVAFESNEIVWWDNAQSVSWVSVSPSSGLVLPGHAKELMVELSGDHLSLGEHVETSFDIHCNDPFNAITRVQLAADMYLPDIRFGQEINVLSVDGDGEVEYRISITNAGLYEVEGQFNIDLAIPISGASLGFNYNGYPVTVSGFGRTIDTLASGQHYATTITSIVSSSYQVGAEVTNVLTVILEPFDRSIHFTNVFVATLADTDGDNFADVTDPDDDGDGMSDRWEYHFGFDGRSMHDAFEDPDGDGRNNLEEFEDQTDPFAIDEPTELGDLVVDKSVPWCDNQFGHPYCNISFAYADAEEGDVISIGDGDYREILYLNKSVDLVGTGHTYLLAGSDVYVSPSVLYSTYGARLTVARGATSYVHGIHISGGVGAGGAGIRNWGDLTLDHVAVESNHTYSIYGTSAKQEGGGIWNDGVLNVVDSTIAHNSAGGNYGPSWGGGIFNNSNGVCMLLRSAVVSNGTVGVSYRSWFGHGATDCYGGGLYNLGSMHIAASTISGNRAVPTHAAGLPSGLGHGYGSAIYSRGQLTIVSSTIVDNQTGNRYRSETADPAVNVLHSSQVGNTIIANNYSPTGTAYDVSGPFVSLGFNLLKKVPWILTGEMKGNIHNMDPRLLPLGDYGGPTKTHLPLMTSPVIDHGMLIGPDVDQRGVPRPQKAGKVSKDKGKDKRKGKNKGDKKSQPKSGYNDIGAVEYDWRDGDKDSMPNDWEREFGLDPDDKSDKKEDPDGDGLTNEKEFKKKTDPFNPDSDADDVLDGDESDKSIRPIRVVR